MLSGMLFSKQLFWLNTGANQFGAFVSHVVEIVLDGALVQFVTVGMIQHGLVKGSWKNDIFDLSRGPFVQFLKAIVSIVQFPSRFAGMLLRRRPMIDDDGEGGVSRLRSEISEKMGVRAFV